MTKYAFLLAEGIKNLWRHKLTAFASIVSITICLLFIGGFIIIGQNTHFVIEYFRAKYKIEVFFSEEKSNEQAKELVNKIKEMENVRSVTFISKEDATVIFKQQYGEDVHSMLGYNPFPASCVVNVEPNVQGELIINGLIQNIQQLGGVSEVHHQGRLIARIERLYNLILSWGFYAALGLILLAVVIVSNTIRLTVYAKKELIEILRAIGASNGFIRAPFVMEAIFQSVIASILAGAMIYGTINISMSYLPQLVRSSLHVDTMVITIITGLGFMIALLGSFRAISKFL